MPLANFPSGGTLFWDANCFLYHFLDTHPVCTYTLHRSEIGDIQAFTSVAVIAEVRHRLMILEACQRFGVSSRNVLAYLKSHPTQIKTLHVCVEAIESLSSLRVDILPLSGEIVLASQRISGEYGLLTNDALIVATMRAHHLIHLASNDTDFSRVPGLTLWRP